MLALQKEADSANRARILSNLSACYLNLGQHEQAKLTAKLSIKCDATFEKAYLRAVKACLSLKEFREASEHVRRLKEACPGSSLVEFLERELAQSVGPESR